MRIEYGSRWYTYEVRESGLPEITEYGDSLDQPVVDHRTVQDSPYWRIEWPARVDVPLVMLDEQPKTP